jgi:predicted RND superfamily exporter protein
MINIENFYKNIIIAYPRRILFLLLIIISFLGTYSLKMQIDASADTLLLENDKDLAFAREVSKRYATQDFLVVTFSPNNGDLLSDTSIKDIQKLSNELNALELVDSITSILNVPLLQSPAKPVKELLKNIPTLLSKGTNRILAKKEFLTSPLYKENLVSNDFKTTAILVNLKSILSKEQNHQNIIQVRQILQKYRNIATINLGGISMIADDLISFVKYDLKTFSIVVFILLVIILYLLFKEIKWVLIPIFICIVSIIATTGILGLFDWKVTVISSNFISLQLIMTLSLAIHLTIKYKELLQNNLDISQEELAYQTATSMIKPSFFVVLTTIAGFSSLVFSDILPVINFGYMMSVGLILSFILTFLLFPTIIILLSKSKIKQTQEKNISFTTKIANIAFNNKKSVIIGAMLVVIFSITGATKLYVENSFIDYFKKDTDIYKGMKAIDENLGGTTPLDIVLTFKDDEIINTNIEEQIVSDDEELDDFDDEFEDDVSDKTYWFTQAKMQKIRLVHNYLDSLPQIGKVLSLSTLNEVGKILNDGKYLDSFELALLNQKLPQEYKNILLSPYVNIEKNQVRITTRILDSQPNLRRDELIKKINKDLKQITNNKTEDFALSNLLILYNNMLQSLFDSQISTLGIVILILFIMFLILFKSFYVAIIALIANIVPVGVIFGFMGWMQIPLDMMTITIAAISIGIAVDDTIHYIHRFKEEFKETNDYKKAMFNTHKSIGTAMFYTSVIIMVGFSVLVLSNFIPTIYFGLLTLLAMFMAIISDLLLLPVLLLIFKPLKKH